MSAKGQAFWMTFNFSFSKGFPRVDIDYNKPYFHQHHSNIIRNLQCPPLEIPITTQESSKVCQPTESETFYLQALIKKLEQPNDSMSIIDEQNSERTLLLPDRTMKKFNLSAYLSQSVYPAECKSEYSETMLNASNIADHLSSAANGKRNVYKRSSSHFADNSMVDEELVLTLSQKCSPDDTCELTLLVGLISIKT